MVSRRYNHVAPLRRPYVLRVPELRAGHATPCRPPPAWTPPGSTRSPARKGVMNAEEGVFKVSFPRDDVKVTVDGMPMPPFMGLTSLGGVQAGHEGRAGDGHGRPRAVSGRGEPGHERGVRQRACRSPRCTTTSSTMSRRSSSCTSAAKGTTEKLAAGRAAGARPVKQIRVDVAAAGEGLRRRAAADKSTLAARRWRQILGGQAGGEGRDGEVHHRPHGEDALRLRGRQGDGRQHVGRVLRVRTTTPSSTATSPRSRANFSRSCTHCAATTSTSWRSTTTWRARRRR